MSINPAIFSFAYKLWSCLGNRIIITIFEADIHFDYACHILLSSSTTIKESLVDLNKMYSKFYLYNHLQLIQQQHDFRRKQYDDEGNGIESDHKMYLFSFSFLLVEKIFVYRILEDYYRHCWHIHTIHATNVLHHRTNVYQKGAYIKM